MPLSPSRNLPKVPFLSPVHTKTYPPMPEKREYKYFAFISYSRRDEAFARRLHRFLTGFNLPSHLCKQHPDKPKNLRPIYRDKTNLGTGNLSKGLSGGLEESKYIVVICSKNSARPNRQGKNWINTEVRSFVALQEGNEDYVIPVLLRKKGEPSAECTPEAVQELHLLAADVSDKGEQRVFSDVAAKMLGLSPDDLWNWWGRVLRRRRIIRWTMSSIATIAAAYTGWWCWDYYTPHYSYFTDYVEFNNIPHGLNPLTEEQVMAMESHYKFTTQRHKLRRVENLNSVGYPVTTSTYPGHEERPVSISLIYDDTTGEVKEHILYDQFNREVIAKRFPDISTITFHRIGEKGEDLGVKGAGFSLGFFDMRDKEREKNLNVERYHVKRDERGAISDISYQNVYGQNIENQFRVSGEHIERDNAGRMQITTNVDSEGNPTRGRANVVHTKLEYNDLGEVINKSYLGKDNSLIAGADGYAIVNYLWENGNMKEVSYLDKNGRPTIDNKNGVSIIKREYDHRGMQNYRGYFNDRGVPCLDKGNTYSSQRREHDEKGNTVVVTFYDEKGELMAKGSCAQIRSKYNESRELISTSYYDSEGKPIIFVGEGARIDWEYDNSGHQISTTYYDEAGNLYNCNEGYARMETKYDERGNISSVAFFDKNGEGFVSEKGWARVEMKHDERGNVTLLEFFGKNGEAVNSIDGFHKAEAKYDSAGKLLSQRYYNESGVQADMSRRVVTNDLSVSPISAAAPSHNSVPRNSSSLDYSGTKEDLEIDLSETAVGGNTSVMFSEAILTLAEQGNAGCQYIVAQCYASGSGVSKDIEQAIKWFDKAAEQGMIIGRVMIAKYYQTGEGIAKNIEEAIRIYEHLIDESDNDSNPGTSHVYGAAMNNLGVCYEKGDGVSKNLEKAFSLYQQAAKKGDIVAKYNLGRCYLNGIGTNRDMYMAQHYLKDAATHGNKKAQEYQKALK